MEKPIEKIFYWGTATSAHQIEGGQNNNWTQWEKSEARLNWLKGNQKNPHDYISGQACDSYHLQNKDIECIKYLNNNAYRFSVEWSRVEPKKGQFNQVALDHYFNFIKKLKANGIEPFVTLWHWTFPLWIWEQGGFENKKVIDAFEIYVKKVIQVMGTEVRFWLTINEPKVYADNSYLNGVWPPQGSSRTRRDQVIKNLIKVHKTAYKTIKAIRPQTQVGFCTNNSYYEAKGARLMNILIKAYYERQNNYYFLNKVKKEIDFIGLNYYFHNLVDKGLNKNDNFKVSDLGWELCPQGLYYVLKDLKKYRKPVFITESGLADSHDVNRSWYIEESIKAIKHAIKIKVDVRGYFHWSLMDNFEWADGFKAKFGLFETNYDNFERRPRCSADYYSKITQKLARILNINE